MSYYQTDYYDGRNPQSLDAKVSSVMKSVYVKMFMALLVTALTAWLSAAWGTEANVAYYIATHRWVYWGLAILELGLVFFITGRLDKLSPAMSTGLFYLFAIVNGLTLSMIFAVYNISGIAKTFAITAGVFGAMSIYGYYTTRSLAKIGSILYMALFGLIILCLVNIFFHSSTLDWIVSGIGVLLFIGLTAWDTQQIKQMAYADPDMANGRLATLGALSLYLDFINLFIYLLRFFGGNRD